MSGLALTLPSHLLVIKTAPSRSVSPSCLGQAKKQTCLYSLTYTHLKCIALKLLTCTCVPSSITVQKNTRLKNQKHLLFKSLWDEGGTLTYLFFFYTTEKVRTLSCSLLLLHAGINSQQWAWLCELIVLFTCSLIDFLQNGWEAREATQCIKPLKATTKSEFLQDQCRSCFWTSHGNRSSDETPHLNLLGNRNTYIRLKRYRSAHFVPVGSALTSWTVIPFLNDQFRAATRFSTTLRIWEIMNPTSPHKITHYNSRQLQE